MILENVNNNVGELVGLTLNPKDMPILQQWTIVLYDSEYMLTIQDIASPLVYHNMSLTHLKGISAGALKLGQDHTQTWVRILQKSQENGQSRTNTDTGKEREYKSRENAIKGQQKSTLGQH
ncbi:hypothetical protein Tco_0994871 [Tanacetum coccineum]